MEQRNDQARSLRTRVDGGEGYSDVVSEQNQSSLPPRSSAHGGNQRKDRERVQTIWLRVLLSVFIALGLLFPAYLLLQQNAPANLKLPSDDGGAGSELIQFSN
ncbi:hypothetical protein N781_18010 [Pontibacillus halophilus JSM 076056 = DSM 19796]|uniref:Uncharacterized protein n=1 Tax=Pontibacillus halophilus JSM 076056 = DSM 19796 TaxID=1385510 RepID=A0A0A5GJU7_9BACI|nr:hypothetical protein [Pontibacillus halophilus]KGX92289.1 hypothetical protein N781_18010 [Pontibacillus halophilus JSM 076056 = DSM 19796]